MSVTAAARLSVFARDDWTCRGCGFRQTEEERREATEQRERWLTVDHIVPRSKGGRDAQKNLQTLCNVCNREKADRCDEDAVTPSRLRRGFIHLANKKAARVVHHHLCDLDYCYCECPVYLSGRGRIYV